MFEPGHANCVRADPEGCLQVLCVHQKSGKFVAVFVQSEENAKTNVVNAAFHSAVHCFCVIIVIVLWSGRMQLKIAFLVVSLLEKDVGADAGFL